jgi:hypothetical protein
MRTMGAIALVIVATGMGGFASPDRLDRAAVTVSRLADGGIQPQAAVDGAGDVHLIFFRGEPAHGDLFYMGSADGGRTFSAPIRVNSTPGAAIATGTVRGGQIAVGRTGRVHVAWNGSRAVGPASTPMFYTRLNSDHTAFVPERNVMHGAYNIDGGGAVAADRNGRVYVVWHANATGEREEGKRRVWVARSDDDGRTFEPERAVFDEPTGACGCCGLGAFADRRGGMYVLFRSAFDVMNRDMYLLTSRDLGAHFSGRRIDRWDVGACVMSTQAFAEGASGIFTAWETKGQIYMGRIDPDRGNVSSVAAVPGDDRTRKHPALAVGADGDVLLAWTEGTAWNKGGTAAWQLFGANARPIGESGRAGGVPVWGRVAAYPRPGRGFALVY